MTALMMFLILQDDNDRDDGDDDRWHLYECCATLKKFYKTVTATVASSTSIL